MAQKPEDFTLPSSSIKKILQDCLPPNVKCTDVTKTALSKAACIFILYVTTSANGFSQDNNRKRILGKDVIEALMEVDMGFIVPSLQSALQDHHRTLLSKKRAKSDKESPSNSDAEEDVSIVDNDLDVGEEVEIIGSGSENEVAEEEESDFEDDSSENNSNEEETQ